MARRLKKYPEKAHHMAPEIEKRFKDLIKKKKEPAGWAPQPLKGWQLWEWDSLKDRPDLNE